MLFWLLGPEKMREPTRLALEEEGWPTFSEINRTVRVMASLFEHNKRRTLHSQISSDLPVPDPVNELALQANRFNTKILDEYESKKWLKALGLRVVEEIVIGDLDQAIHAASELGYPVVLKGRAEGQIHKTEAGLVKLNLWNVAQLTFAYQEMMRLDNKPRSFLIQPMLRGDMELIAGIVRDSQFGPAVMLGVGGVWAEVYKDVAFRLVPLHPEEIPEMVSDLRGQALLNGFRGSKPVNFKSLGDWLTGLGWLALKFNTINQIDVNPLLIVEGEPVAVDATIIFR